jgi:predicted nucleic acid-binding protein
LRVVEDYPDDDRVLECAVEGHADFIVTGDRHLLKLGEYHGVSILRTRQFLDSLEL